MNQVSQSDSSGNDQDKEKKDVDPNHPSHPDQQESPADQDGENRVENGKVETQTEK